MPSVCLASRMVSAISCASTLPSAVSTCLCWSKIFEIKSSSSKRIARLIVGMTFALFSLAKTLARISARVSRRT
jgi:hypothetical protein